MTRYPTPLEQQYGTNMANLRHRLAVVEAQLAQLATSQLLYKTVLTAPTASVRLPGTGSLPQGYTNLRVVMSAQSDGTGTSGYDNAFMQFNGVTAASDNWSTWYSTQGAGSVSTAGGTGQTSMQCAAVWNSHFGSAAHGVTTIQIPGYSGTGYLKGFLAHSAASDGGAAGVMQLYSGFLGGSNTGPITYLSIAMGTGNFKVGSEFCVYGE